MGEVKRWQDRLAFVGVARPVLVEREAENAVMLGILSALEEKPSRKGEMLWTVGENVVGLRSAVERPFLVSRGEAADIERLAELVAGTGEWLIGTGGPRESAEAFARVWGGRMGCGVRVHLLLRAFELRRVTWPVPMAGGKLEVAREGDVELLAGWRKAFAEGIGEPVADARKDVMERIAEGRLYVWVDGGTPRSMAVTMGPTPNGIRVGGVYTPLEYRGRGYASACVAAVSQRMLDGGKRMVFLNSDVANRTSTGIYERMGYRAVCDWVSLRFEKP